jgi:hypothetical protein
MGVEAMAEEQVVYRPGERIPELGVYESEGPVEQSFNADTLGEFPPLPEGCSGWRLARKGPVGPGGFTAEEVPSAEE